MAENAKGIIALNAVVTGAESVKSLRTQLDEIIKTGGGRVRLTAETTVVGDEQVKQKIIAIGQVFNQLNANVAASLSFLDRAVTRMNAIMARVVTTGNMTNVRMYPGTMGKGQLYDPVAVKQQLTGSIARRAGVPIADVAMLAAYNKQASLLSSVMGNVERIGTPRQNVDTIERVNKQLERVNRVSRRLGLPAIPMELNPAETQKYAVNTLYAVGQQTGSALLPRQSIKYLPQGAALAMANPNFYRKSLYQRIAGRLGDIEGGSLQLDQSLIREAEKQIAGYGKYGGERIRVLPSVEVPTTGRIIRTYGPTRSDLIGSVLREQPIIRSTLGYNFEQSLRTPEQYTAMLAPGIAEFQHKYEKLLGAPVKEGKTIRDIRGLASLRARIGRGGLLLDPTGGQEDILSQVAAQTAKLRNQFAEKAAARLAVETEPLPGDEALAGAYKRNPFIRGVYVGKTLSERQMESSVENTLRGVVSKQRGSFLRSPISEQADIFQGGALGYFQYPGVLPKKYQQYLGQIAKNDIFQGIGKSQYQPYVGPHQLPLMGSYYPGRMDPKSYYNFVKSYDIFQKPPRGFQPFTPGGGFGGGGFTGLPPEGPGPFGSGPPQGGGGSRAGLLGRFGQRFMGLGYYSLAAAVIYPIMTGIYSTLSRAKELEVILTRIKGIYGDGSINDQLMIRREVVGTATQYSTDLLETARSAQLLAQEQMRPEELRTNLRAISMGAIGMGIDQEGLTNFIIAVRNATATGTGRVEGPELVNLLAAFQRRGAVAPQNLMTSIQQILPSLEIFQGNDEQVRQNIALIGAITSQVARRTNYTGSQVGNALRYFIARFGSPQTAVQLERLTGVQFGTKESGGQQLRPFREILQDIAVAYNKFLQEGQTSRAAAILREGFGLRQVGVGQNVLSAESFNEILKQMQIAMDDTTSASTRAAESQKTLEAALERLSTQMTNAAEGVNTFLKYLAVGIAALVFPSTITQGLSASEKIKIAAVRGGAREGLIYGGGLGAIGGALVGYGVGALMNIPKTPQGPFLPPEFLTGKRPGGVLPTTQTMFSAAIRAQNMPVTTAIAAAQATAAAAQVATTGAETAPYFDPTDWDTYHRYFKTITQRISGEQFTAKLLGNLDRDPKKDLNQIVNLLDRFYASIHAADRPEGMSLEAYIAKLDPALYGEVLPHYRYLLRLLPAAQATDTRRQAADFDRDQNLKAQAEQRRFDFQVSRMNVRLSKVYGKRGLTENIGDQLQTQLEEIAANRQQDILNQQAALPVALAKLRASSEYRQNIRGDVGRQELERELLDQYNLDLKITENKYELLTLEERITAEYETRLRILMEIEALAKEMNSVVKNSLTALPTMTRTRGVLGHFLGSILAPAAGVLYGNVLDQVNIFGRQGLFPGVGKMLSQITGKPPDLTGVSLWYPGIPGGKPVPAQTQEQYRKSLVQAQIRALEIAAAATAGAYTGKGGLGAQTGGQLGAIGGFAIGAKFGTAAGGPIGALVGGILGGLLGGIFDKPKKKPPELIALEKISENTGEQITLIENTNRLLELQNVSFNVPTGFTLPAYSSSIFGGQTAGVSNEINVQVNVGVANATAGEIGQVVAQAISTRLNNEYRSAGKYVPRSSGY